MITTRLFILIAVALLNSISCENNISEDYLDQKFQEIVEIPPFVYDDVSAKYIKNSVLGLLSFHVKFNSMDKKESRIVLEGIISGEGTGNNKIFEDIEIFLGKADGEILNSIRHLGKSNDKGNFKISFDVDEAEFLCFGIKDKLVKSKSYPVNKL